MENRRIKIENVGQDSLEYIADWEEKYGTLRYFFNRNLCNSCEKEWDRKSSIRYILFNKGSILWWHWKHGVQSFKDLKK